jgi:hypothetical protein
VSLFLTPSDDRSGAREPSSPEGARLLRGLGSPDQPPPEDKNALPDFAQAPVRAKEPPPLPPGTPEEAGKKRGVEVCPRCQARLVDPQGMGWCQACGFCRSVEEGQGQVPGRRAATAKPSLLGANEFGFLLTHIPGWVYVLVVGCGAVFVASLMPATQLPEGSYERAVWATVQIVVGLVMIFGGQLIVLFALAPLDEKLSFKDAVLPFRIWALAFQRGGRFRVPFWLGSWGLSAVVAAFFVIGGLEYWERYLPRSRPPEQQQAPPAPKKI